MDLGNTGLVATFALLMGASWIAFMRFRMKPDSSWPLVFYLLLVVYSNQNSQAVPPYVLYVAVVCGLLLRFEFLNERLIFFGKVIEVICLAIIAWSLLAILGKYS
jgi:hypothetical protein